MIEDQIGNMAGALVLQGSVPSNEFTAALTNHTAGWTFVVTRAGTYVGQQCSVGDMIICKVTGTSEANQDWFVVESNQPNMVTGEGASANENLPVYSGTSGKVIKNSGTNLSNILVSTPSQGMVHPPKSGTSSVQELSGDEINKIKQQLGVGGVASEAAKLSTARTIDGVEFNGTGNVSHTITCSTEPTFSTKTINLNSNVKINSGLRLDIWFQKGSKNIENIQVVTIEGTTVYPVITLGTNTEIPINTILPFYFISSVGSFICAYTEKKKVFGYGEASKYKDYLANGDIVSSVDNSGNIYAGVVRFRDNDVLDIPYLAYMDWVEEQVNGKANNYDVAAFEWLSHSHLYTVDENTISVIDNDISDNSNAVNTIKDILSCDNLGVFRVRSSDIKLPSSSTQTTSLKLSIFSEEALPIQWGSIALTNSMFNALANLYVDLEFCCRGNGISYRLTNVERINVGGVIYYPDGSTSDENVIEKLQTPFFFSSKSPSGNGLTFNSNLNNNTDAEKLKTYIENGGIIHLNLNLGSSWESMQSRVTVGIGITYISLEGTCFLTFGSGSMHDVTGTELRRKAEQGIISVRYRDGNFEVLYWDSIITDDNKILYYNGDTVEFTEG